MSNQDIQTLIQLILYVLGPGAGAAVYNTVKWLVAQLTDAHHAPSEFATRWLTYFVSVAEPTVLYFIVLWLSNMIQPTPFNPATLILDILAAFGVSQGIHGQRDLNRAPKPVKTTT